MGRLPSAAEALTMCRGGEPTSVRTAPIELTTPPRVRHGERERQTGLTLPSAATHQARFFSFAQPEALSVGYIKGR
jgi:hypothetical protein